MWYQKSPAKGKIMKKESMFEQIVGLVTKRVLEDVLNLSFVDFARLAREVPNPVAVTGGKRAQTEFRHEEAIPALLIANGPMNVSRIAQALGVEKKYLEKPLLRLRAQNKIVKHGIGPASVYWPLHVRRDATSRKNRKVSPSPERRKGGKDSPGKRGWETRRRNQAAAAHALN